MRVPTRKEALSWYEDQGTPDNIMRHVNMVNKVAMFLAEKLKEKGIKLDLGIIDMASLLHDLDKWSCINNKNLNHGFETEKILAEKGYPELGFYARQHKSPLIIDGLKSWEEKIIHYADKRVLHDKIVSLEKRFEYINEKYPSDDKAKEKLIKDLSFDLEKEIFSKLDILPEDIAIFVSETQNT